MDTMNWIMYQMTKFKRRSEDGMLVIEVRLDRTEVWKIKSRAVDMVEGDANDILEKMREAVIETEEAQEECNSTVEDAAAAVSQAVVAEVKAVSSMALLASSEEKVYQPDRTWLIRNMKESISCKACRKRGHWWTDNEECKENIYNKRRTKEFSDGLTSVEGEVESCERPTEVKESKSLFPRGGQ